MNGDYYRKAKFKTVQHEKSMKDKQNKRNALAVMNITFVGFAGITNNIVNVIGADNKAYNLSFSVILYLSLLVTGLQKFFNFEESIEKHRVSSILYSVLCQNIEDEIIPAQYIRSQYQFLKSMEPYIPEPDINMLNIESEQKTSRDIEIDFEMDKLDNNS